jgi:hypothetical protein
MSPRTRNGRAFVLSLFELNALALWGCGSPEIRHSPVDAEPSVDATAPIDGGPADGQASVLPIVEPALASNDPRLVPVGSVPPGGSPNGWDGCNSPTPLRGAPMDCAACPAAPASQSYLRYTGPIPTGTCDPSQTCPPPFDSQVFGYFTPALVAGSPQAVWFDLVHLAGDPADATLTVYATFGCTTVETLGTWGMADILGAAKGWRSTCVTVTPRQPTAELGFHFSGAQVDFGMHGPWFGPPCPAR